MAENPSTGGTLYIVSTPIGNDDDITVRGLKILKSCDLVVCEEAKEGAKLLKINKISKDIIELNEHNEEENTPEVLAKLRAGKNVALISDAGTPILADPGLFLLRQVLAADLPVVVVPGVSSILTALVRSGFPASQFLYAGFLSRKASERIEQLEALAQEPRTVVILDTPYRLKAFLAAAAEVMPGRRAYIGCNLTMPFETHHYGTFAELQQKFEEKNFRGEFVICFEGAEQSAAAKAKRGRKTARREEPAQGEREIAEETGRNTLLEFSSDEFDADEAQELKEEAGIGDEDDTDGEQDGDQPRKRPRIKREAPQRRERGGTSGVYSSSMQSGSYGDNDNIDRSAMRTEGYSQPRGRNWGGKSGGSRQGGGPRGGGGGNYAPRGNRSQSRPYGDDFGNRRFDDREGGQGRGQGRPYSGGRGNFGGRPPQGDSMDQPPRRRSGNFGDGPPRGGGGNFPPRGNRPQQGGGEGFGPRQGGGAPRGRSAGPGSGRPPGKKFGGPKPPNRRGRP